ncbi:MAG: 1-acyl-sn-glycerol-3-phosphate acyltransferase, partial [Bryobacteraceae bacterium]
DVEKVLNRIPGVRESAVIGKDRVHAVLALDDGASPEEIAREANRQLEDHQKIRSVSVWTGGDLPRTQTTRKLRRAEIAEAISKGTTASAPAQNGLAALIQKYAPGRTITPETTLDELGLSSLDRVQLMMDLEQKFGTEIDERALSSAEKVADLARPAAAPPVPPMKFPEYNQAWYAKFVRRLALPYFLLPLARVWAHIHVTGRENLASIHTPVIFASNHQSHLDVLVILASLPARWRYRVSTAMSKEHFMAHFFPEEHTLRERAANGLSYFLGTFMFNAFPIPQRHPGAGQTIQYMGGLIEQGGSILIFPEGDRTSTGELLPFQPGIGMIATRLNVPVVPLRIVGLDRVLHRDWYWPRMGRVEVRIGAPMTLRGEDFAALAKQVEQAVREL